MSAPLATGAGWVLGLALLLALGLLETVAGDGGLALVATALLLLLGPLGRGSSRGGRLPLWRQVAAASFPALAAAAALVVVARGALPVAGPPGLATVARGVGLLGATLLWRTPPALLPLHALGVLMVLWTSAALEQEVDAPRALVTLSALVLLAQGLALGRSAEARAEAVTTAGVGLAAGPPERAPSPFPALVAAALAALPAGLGLAVPRPGVGGAAGAAQGGAWRSGAMRDQIRFAPELRLDRPRGPLGEDDRVVARLTAEPEPPTLFLRGATLPRLSEAGFFPAPAGEVDPEPAARDEVPVLLDVSVEAPQAGYLPVAGRVVGLEGVAPRAVPGGWAAPEGAGYPLRYQARCQLPDPAQELRLYAPLADPRWLEVPVDLRRGALPGLAAEAAQGASAAERAGAVAHWLQARCAYDLRAGARGTSAAARLEAFLLQDRRGVCTEFAAAMAVLLRLVGDPARVVTGWRVVERDLDDRRVIRERHAHAWVEIPLQGAGWVPFDPTPDPAPGGEEEEPARPQGAAAAAPGGAEAERGDPGATAGRSAPARPLVRLGLLLLAGALLGAGAAGRAARRRRWEAELGGGEGVASAPWKDERERLFALLAARGFLPGRAQTPLEFLRGLSRPGGEREARARAGLEQAVRLYTVLRFSGRPEPGGREALHAALRAAS